MSLKTKNEVSEPGLKFSDCFKLSFSLFNLGSFCMAMNSIFLFGYFPFLRIQDI